MKTIWVKVLITIVAVAAAGVRVGFPHLLIDTTTIVLIVLAALPWLSELIESAELPGGWKIKFRSLQDIAEKSTQIGLAESALSKQDQETYSFQLVSPDDPNLALAGLRIEIEKRLKSLAEAHDIGTRMRGVGSLMNDLYAKGVIGTEERSLIADLIGTLNQAVHGAKIERDGANWAMEFGPRLLRSLDRRIDRGQVSRE